MINNINKFKEKSSIYKLIYKFVQQIKRFNLNIYLN
jgi:hypothetical protein